ncbi:MAG: hypothetical protein SFU25_00280 [Candidatus Caenarcaniphilales bacterium]|nr:hypothetical protein [Candidatus Caenarcaniphilales bacterium]
MRILPFNSKNPKKLLNSSRRLNLVNSTIPHLSNVYPFIPKELKHKVTPNRNWFKENRPAELLTTQDLIEILESLDPENLKSMIEQLSENERQILEELNQSMSLIQ